MSLCGPSLYLLIDNDYRSQVPGWLDLGLGRLAGGSRPGLLEPPRSPREPFDGSRRVMGQLDVRGAL